MQPRAVLLVADLQADQLRITFWIGDNIYRHTNPSIHSFQRLTRHVYREVAAGRARLQVNRFVPGWFVIFEPPPKPKESK